METPNINTDRYVSTNSLRDTHSQSVHIPRSSLPWSDNTDSGQRLSGNEENKNNNSSSESIDKYNDEMKDDDVKGISGFNSN